MLSYLIVGFILALNFAISWWNAYAVGRVWHESKLAGGWPRLLAWSGAVMSACGFTYVYLAVLTYTAYATGYLPEEYAQGAVELGYVAVIFPILGSGLIIWVDSVKTAWKERTFGSMAGAAWNTYAQGSNMYHAARDLPGVFSHLGKLFGSGSSSSSSSSKSDDSGRLLLLMVLVAVFALAGGVLTTYSIMRSSAREALRDSRMRKAMA